MALSLTYTGKTSVPVEIEGFTPTWAREKSLAEIERFEIFHGNQKLPLAEMFQVAGSADDLRFDFEGDLSGVHWIGAQMSEGEIHIHGPAGRHVGSEMQAGKIRVEGDADGWVGAEMRGGFIHVCGNAGHLVGAAYRGSPKGMTGGTILVDGNAGNEIGLTMRRGMIAIGGSAGDMLGFNMIAGTVLVFGECGIRPGAGMRRGTLGLLGPNPPSLLPSFRYACTASPQVLPMIFKQLREQGLKIDESQFAGDCEIFNGDMVALGRGEIFVRTLPV
ncbi:MAG: formylmethanofuran dehydrogenase subunit C [Planctomycetes bacterium]|nr:formylmethanofuran dehydrogenase subunit C [Planctomycetota bacterium]